MDKRQQVDTLGIRLQQMRLERNMSLSALSKRANVAKSYLSAIERHIQVNPSLHVLERISSVLDVPIQVLISDMESASSDKE